MSSSNGNIMWQSFDHPTNAFLPGAKFGYNNLTKKDQKITSWRNTGDPSEGFYSIELEPDKSVSFKWNQSREFYNSGAWNGRFFSNFPEMRIGVVTSYDITSYENRSFFTFSAPNEAAPIYVFIDLSGQLKAPIWQPKTQDWMIIWVKPMQPCKVYGICGAFSVCSDNNAGPSICQCLPGFEKYNPKDWDLLDYSGGCIRKTSLQCGDKDNFKKLPNMDVSRIIPSADALVVDDAKKCESFCLKNCSCDAYAYYKNSSGNSKSFMCLLWYSNLLNIEQLGGDKGNDLFIRLAASEVLDGSKMKASTIWTIVGVIGEENTRSEEKPKRSSVETTGSDEEASQGAPRHHQAGGTQSRETRRREEDQRFDLRRGESSRSSSDLVIRDAVTDTEHAKKDRRARPMIRDAETPVDPPSETPRRHPSIWSSETQRSTPSTPNRRQTASGRRVRAQEAGRTLYASVACILAENLWAAAGVQATMAAVCVQATAEDVQATAGGQAAAAGVQVAAAAVGVQTVAAGASDRQRYRGVVQARLPRRHS
ncbi:hypothetical protein Syun_010427 [Stephania yunnanensis]|uniref:Apple domain-containing protein n=1 Tax=Stephania yunnanensis TaxID=152371 RepID=A0AAP0KI23_9MAGN